MTTSQKILHMLLLEASGYKGNAKRIVPVKWYGYRKAQVRMTPSESDDCCQLDYRPGEYSALMAWLCFVLNAYPNNHALAHVKIDHMDYYIQFSDWRIMISTSAQLPPQ